VSEQLPYFEVYKGGKFVAHVRARTPERAIATAGPYTRRKGHWRATRIEPAKYAAAVRAVMPVIKI